MPSERTPGSAGAELDRALELDPEHTGLLKCRAELLRRLGDLEGAARDAAEAVILDRDDPAAKALLGELLLLLERAHEAVACLADVVQAVPRDIAAREMLARALTADGDLDGALSTLLEGIELLPGATALRNAAALLCIRQRDFTQAERLAERARLDSVADASTYGLKGHALSSLGRHREAAVAYREASKLAPGDPYARHLSGLADIDASAPRTPDAFVRALFDDDADRFEGHLIGLGYRVPSVLRGHVIDFATVANIGPVLDLGCGTGLMALALSDLALGPFTGIDLSPRMLDVARSKGIYATLHEARLPDALREQSTSWRLILAADVLCYIGALEEFFDAVRDRLKPGGRFMFSVEELLPEHDGTIRGNGDWFLGRLGRFAHAAEYVARTADARGFECLTFERQTLRYEAGGPVAGLILVLERPRDDA
jgi:predicted TPR repeat methyltransferase